MSEQKMFRKGEPRYLTNGIEARLPVMYQIFIWDIIDGLREQGQELAYFQVFELEVYEIGNKENTEDNTFTRNVRFFENI